VRDLLPPRPADIGASDPGPIGLLGDRPRIVQGGVRASREVNSAPSVRALSIGVRLESSWSCGRHPQPKPECHRRPDSAAGRGAGPVVATAGPVLLRALPAGWRQLRLHA
jgi:hypothetical protein